MMMWVSLLAFVRLSTHPNVYEHPLTSAQALDVVETWLGTALAITPEPDALHATRMRELLAATGRGGNLVSDAHLAALAVQYGATVVTFDTDFARFPGVSAEDPRS